MILLTFFIAYTHHLTTPMFFLLSWISVVNNLINKH